MTKNLATAGAVKMLCQLKSCQQVVFRLFCDPSMAMLFASASDHQNSLK